MYERDLPNPKFRPGLLARASVIAPAFVQNYVRPDVVGIVLLGAFRAAILTRMRI